MLIVLAWTAVDAVACDAGSRGELVSVHHLRLHRNGDRMDRYFDAWVNGLSALGYVEDTVEPDSQNGAETFEVRYCTVDFDGTPILGSGLLAVPLTLRFSPTVVYLHGTAVTRIDTPSNPNVNQTFDGPSAMVYFAGHDYLFLAPDLTGFGASEAERHRYLDAETGAASALDMLDAVDDLWVYRLKSNGELFNYGFSAGGHTALAFAEAAEAAGYDLDATATIGGVTDPDRWFDFASGEVDNPYLTLYPANLIQSYERVYGDVYASPSDAFASPFDETVEDLFDMNHLYFEVVEGLPGSVEELTTPAFYADLLDPASVMRGHLQDNTAESVCLDHPIRLYHSVDDAEVPFFLAEAALANLDACNDVTLEALVGLDHLNAWHVTTPDIRGWFDTF